ncbi:hypothetical protein STRTUCAR8_07489, partial [Streptomyces turgidiscabies Car8]
MGAPNTRPHTIGLANWERYRSTPAVP